jgi:hypothetical protein
MTGRGRRAVRIVVAVALLVVAVWLLFVVVFPWVDRVLNDPVLGATAGAVATRPPAQCTVTAESAPRLAALDGLAGAAQNACPGSSRADEMHTHALAVGGSVGGPRPR